MNSKRRRLVIVRRGSTALFKELKARFADDSSTRVIWDRRATDRRSDASAVAHDRRRGRRRFPHDPSVLSSRGYFVTYERVSLAARV